MSLKLLRPSLLLGLLLSTLGSVCAHAATPSANYQLEFEGTWSEARHPQEFPGDPHFSGLVGGTHNESVSFWAPGALAAQGIQSVAETGATTDMVSEVGSAISAGSADRLLEGGGIALSPGSVGLNFTANDTHPLLTIVSMIAPSPDWFAGVHALPLMSNGEWRNTIEVELFAYDSGTDDGTEYTSADAVTDPAQVITRIDGSPFNGVSVATLRLTRTDAPEVVSPSTLVASVLPASRSVETGETATAFATMINSGETAGTNCSIGPGTQFSGEFSYQITDMQNASQGEPNTPVNIAAQGGQQSFVVSLTPDSELAPTELALEFSCDNIESATSLVGLNTLLLSASDTPVADVVALAATVNNDGIVRVDNAGAFSVASINLGVAENLTVIADTGDAVLPLELSLCQTNPTTGDCLSTPVAATDGLDISMASGATPTFGVFASATGSVALDAAANRIYVRFVDSTSVRGATSVAVQTVTPE